VVHAAVKILFALRHNQIQAQQQQGEPYGGEIPFNNARYRKTVKTALCLQVTLIACYLPYSIVIAIISISRIISISWCHVGVNSISCLFKLVSQPNSLLLEDQGSKPRSKEHDQTVALFVKLVSWKTNEYIYQQALKPGLVSLYWTNKADV